MTDTDPITQNYEDIFWPPLFVFLFGVPFAAENWWKMAKRSKAIFFLSMSVLMILFKSWTDIEEKVTDTDDAIFFEVWLTRLFISATYTGVMAIITHFDINRFQKEGENPRKVKGFSVIFFWVILFAVSVGIKVGLDYGARKMELCRFPRLQDVVYQVELEQRTGLESLVPRRNDFCGFSYDWYWWDWKYETLRPMTGGYRLRLKGYLKNEDINFKDFEWLLQPPESSRLRIEERIFQYPQVTETDFSIHVETIYHLRGPEYIVNVEDPYAKFSNVDCVGPIEYTDCNIILGYQYVVTAFEIKFARFSYQEINELLQLIVTTSSDRIREYESK